MSKQNDANAIDALATLQATLDALQAQHSELKAQHDALVGSLVTFTLNPKLGANSAYSYFESANGLKVTVTKSGLKAGQTTVRVVGDAFDVQSKASKDARVAALEAQLAELTALLKGKTA